MGEPSHVVDVSDSEGGISTSSGSFKSSSDLSADGDARAVQEELLININKLAEAINFLPDKLAIAITKSQSDPNTSSLQTGAPGVLMVVATLIATLTFQAALNPPGGFIPPEDHDIAITPRPSLSLARYGNTSGKAVLGYELLWFLLFDMIAFLASLCIILLFICVVPRKKNNFVRFLAWLMWVAVVSTGVALSFAIAKIFPVSYYPIRVVIIALIGVCGLFVLWLIVRFVVYLTRKIVAKIKKTGV